MKEAEEDRKIGSRESKYVLKRRSRWKSGRRRRRRRKMRKRRGLLETKTKRSILEEGDIGREQLEKGKR